MADFAGLFTFFFSIGLALTVLSAIHLSWIFQFKYAQYFENPPANNSDFDFIVVGAGTSGSVVAARLAQEGHHVLLVEAGGPSHFLQGIPAFALYFMKTPYGWQDQVFPSEDVSKVLQNGAMDYPLGKTLGGSSMLNWMVYFRGHSGDYNEWARLGNRGWNYDEVLPYFKKSEDLRGIGSEKFHGSGGPLSVEPSHLFPMDNILKEALREKGFKFGDVNGELESAGFFTNVPLTVNNGWRLGSYRSFVEPLLETPEIKLEVLTFAQVAKLIFKDKQIIGVQVDRFGETYVYRSTKEVILSAGAIRSPQVLMLSGIGPKEHLEQMDIEVVKDAPVGKNLQDHIMVLYPYQTTFTNLTQSVYDLVNPLNYADFLLNGKGFLASGSLNVVGAFHSPENGEKQRPDLQIHFTPTDLNLDNGAGLYQAFNYNKTAFDELMSSYRGHSLGATLMPTLLHPKSVGFVELRSNDFKDSPIIQPNYLSHPSDVSTMVEAMKFCHSLQHTKAFKEWNLIPPKADKSNCGQFKQHSNEYWECFVKHWHTTVYHPVGTCKMGPESDKQAVVDDRLRVRGVKGLRVIDASIMPKLVGSNTQAACYMIGEKGADMIIQDWRRKQGDYIMNNDDEKNEGNKKCEL